MGDDVLNADDNHDTAGGLNDQPDAPQFADRDFAFGGGGLDVLIANTGGDRLFDWTGEFNSFLVPFSPFGEPTISRDPSPHVFAFLLDLGRESGADQTLAEPNGELGLVTQQDPEFGDQHGGPRDPQPGNTHAHRDTHGGPEDDRNTALPLDRQRTPLPPPSSTTSGNGADARARQRVHRSGPGRHRPVVLFVGGTSNGDVIEVRAGSAADKIRVLVNGVDKRRVRPHQRRGNGGQDRRLRRTTATTPSPSSRDLGSSLEHRPVRRRRQRHAHRRRRRRLPRRRRRQRPAVRPAAATS